MDEGRAALVAETWSVVTFLVYTALVFLLAFVSHRFLRGRGFLGEYFLGSRGLGVWALALTYAATSASGGSFTGFPALIYQHGWILALWISSYMVVPVVCMGLLGKRINQVSRKTGAITLPDILRDRYGSRRVGILLSLLLAFFLGFNLVAQFKAGGVIVLGLLRDQPLFQSASGAVAWMPAAFAFLNPADEPSAQYYLALLLFAGGVIIYTAYGGFRAVVWTDVLQGVVMLVGVLLLLPLAIWKAGGLGAVTEDLARQEVPRSAEAELVLRDGEERALGRGHPVEVEHGGRRHVFETARAVELTPEAPRQVVALAAREPGALPAAGWTGHAGERTAETAMVGGSGPAGSIEIRSWTVAPRHGLLAGPGPEAGDIDGFLPFGLALSFFVMWAITGAGQPGTLVRLMAFRSSRVLRRAIFAATIYYSLIYLPLVIIFVCARKVLPELGNPDNAMPEMVKFVAPAALAGILLAAPFAAVMSTVDSFLLIISSSLVRDIYQRSLRPAAPERTIQRASYVTTVLVGVVVTLGAMNPPRYLQDLIVFSGAGLACTFLAPMVLALYWKRSTVVGMYAAILGGSATLIGLYAVNWVVHRSVGPFNLAGILPAVWGLVVSFAAGVVGSWLSRPPSRDRIRFYFAAPSRISSGNARSNRLEPHCGGG